jgi:integrase
MSKAWLFQKVDDVERQGEEQAPHYVGWYEPDGRRKAKCFGAGQRAKKLAQRFRCKVEAELLTGTYDTKVNVLWDDFVAEYTRRVLSGLEEGTRTQSLIALAHFKRLVRLQRVFSLDAGHLDDFVARRRAEPGRRRGESVSAATLNKELRHLRAALGVARRWGYLKEVPPFRMERQVRRIPRYVTPEHFAILYEAAGLARLPVGLPYPAADWWRGAFVFLYLTGWRIGDLLGLARDDCDLEQGYAITRAEVAKADRDDRVRLPPVAVDHLRRLAALDPLMFPWPHDRRTLDEELDRIQIAAGIDLPCARAHEHTPSCHTYSWHDFRRAFATLNAGRIGPDALQALMRHKSYATTQVYVAMARQADEGALNVFVPEVLRRASGGA